MKGLSVISIAFILTLVALAAMPGEAVSCGDVQGSLAPCVAYLTSGGEPSGSCCNGVRGLVGSAQSQQDKQTVCNCIKSAATSVTVNPDAAANLPGKCGVSVGYSISPNIDCSQIS